jgi:hypothetical protein
MEPESSRVRRPTAATEVSTFLHAMVELVGIILQCQGAAVLNETNVATLQSQLSTRIELTSRHSRLASRAPPADVAQSHHSDFIRNKIR